MYSSESGFSDAEVAYQLAHITETKAPSIIAAAAVLTVLATIAVVLRFYVRWHMKSGVKADDYTIFCAWVYIKPTMNGLGNVTKLEADTVLGIVRVCLLWYNPSHHFVTLLIANSTGIETRCGLGKHALATTPEQLTGLLKVKGCPRACFDAATNNTITRPSSMRDQILQSV